MYMYHIGLVDSIKLLRFSLKLVDGYVFYLLIFSIMIISYLFIRPLITWFVTLQSIRLLSYLFSSLSVLLLIFIVTFSIEELNHLLINLFKVTLHCLAIFGCGLAIIHVFQRIINRKGI